MRSTSPGLQKNITTVSPKNMTISPKQLSKSPKISTKSLSLSKSASKRLSKPSTSQHPLSNHMSIIQKMSSNRLRLCNTLDTYTLLIRSNNPIRCLQHNSSISIYCQTQQKLLCSNCIFRKIDHKYHKVIPVDKAQDKMVRDVEIMQRQIQREVSGIQQVYKKMFKHFQEEQKYGQEYLIKITKQFEVMRVLMAQWEIQTKRKVIQELEKVQVKYQMVLSQLEFLKNVYKDQYIQVPPTKDSNYLLYQHAMCNTVVNQGKFAHTKWGSFINQMQTLGLKQQKKILLVLDQIQGNLEKNKVKDKK